MPPPEPDITPKILLDHLQNMGHTLRQEIRGVEQRLSVRIDGLERSIDGLGRSLTERIDRVERNLSRQIDAIDKCLDELEIEHLPRRVAALERGVAR